VVIVSVDVVMVVVMQILVPFCTYALRHALM
jgi:hypothetical protein